MNFFNKSIKNKCYLDYLDMIIYFLRCKIDAWFLPLINSSLFHFYTSCEAKVSCKSGQPAIKNKCFKVIVECFTYQKSFNWLSLILKQTFASIVSSNLKKRQNFAQFLILAHLKVWKTFECKCLNYKGKCFLISKAERRLFLTLACQKSSGAKNSKITMKTEEFQNGEYLEQGIGLVEGRRRGF